MKTFVRTWFGLLAFLLLSMFFMNVLILGSAGIYPISLAVMFTAILFGILSCYPRLVVNSAGRIQDRSLFVGLLFIAIPVSLFCLAFVILFFIHYPKSGRHELQLVPRPLTYEEEQAFYEYLRWTADWRGMHLVEERVGASLRSPLPGVKHPAPEPGVLSKLGFPSSRAMEFPDMTPAMKEALSEFWLFLAENEFRVPSYQETAEIDDIELNPTLPLEAFGWEALLFEESDNLQQERALTQPKLQGCMAILRTLQQQNLQSSSLYTFQGSGRVLLSILQELAPFYSQEEDLPGASELHRILAQILQARNSAIITAIACDNMNAAEALRNSREEYLRGLEVGAGPVGPPIQPTLLNRLGAYKLAPLLAIFILDEEAAVAFQEKFLTNCVALSQQPYGPEHCELLQQYQEDKAWKGIYQTMLRRNEFEKKLALIRLRDLESALTQHFTLQTQLHLHITALEILQTAKLPEDICNGVALIIQPAPGNPDTHLLITVPEDSPLRNWVDQEEDLQLTIPRPAGIGEE